MNAQTLEKVAQKVSEMFNVNSSSITRETTADSVPGWDSLSHAVLIVAIEELLEVQLPIERLLVVRNVGELVDLIDECRV